MFDLWLGPGHRQAVDWVELELANLRAGFRWAADRHEIETATSIAAHTTLVNYSLTQYESVGWAEELVPVAVEADVRQLPRLLVAACMSLIIGHDSALEYARLAGRLEATGRYEIVSPGWGRLMEAEALALGGDMEGGLRILGDLAASNAVSSRVFGLFGLLFFLPAVGRADEAALLADEAADAARAWGWPVMVASISYAYGRVFATIDPPRALAAVRSGLEYSRQHRVFYAELYNSYELAVVEAESGDFLLGLDLFDFSIDNWQRAGDRANLPAALASLAMCFAGLGEQETAAVIYGASTRFVTGVPVAGPLAKGVEQLRTNLGAAVFDRCVATGAAMETGDAVAYARQHIRLAQQAGVTAREV